MDKGEISSTLSGYYYSSNSVLDTTAIRSIRALFFLYYALIDGVRVLFFNESLRIDKMPSSHSDKEQTFARFHPKSC
jgi:hypothetical protein